jgi:hypothetical protein
MILEDYVPEEYATNDDRFYRFTFPCVGQDAVFVFEVLSTGERVPVRQQDMVIQFASSPRDPLKYRGSVRMLRAHTAGTELVRIERNTFMDQVVDFRTFSPFNTRMIEFTFDKLTMIAQEINDRKCETSVSVPITQEVTFGSYWSITAGQINRCLEKINRILFEIDQSGTDCRWNNEPYEDYAP